MADRVFDARCGEIIWCLEHLDDLVEGEIGGRMVGSKKHFEARRERILRAIEQRGAVTITANQLGKDLDFLCGVGVVERGRGTYRLVPGYSDVLERMRADRAQALLPKDGGVPLPLSRPTGFRVYVIGAERSTRTKSQAANDQKALRVIASDEEMRSIAERLAQRLAALGGVESVQGGNSFRSMLAVNQLARCSFTFVPG